MIKQELKPMIIEQFTDNGMHSHWSAVDGNTGNVICEDIQELRTPILQDKGVTVEQLEEIVKEAWNAGWASSHRGKGTPNLYWISLKHDLAALPTKQKMPNLCINCSSYAPTGLVPEPCKTCDSFGSNFTNKPTESKDAELMLAHVNEGNYQTLLAMNKAEIHSLTAQIAEMREALEMYANEMFYFPRSLIHLAHEKKIRLAPCYSEFGERAQSVLDKFPKAKASEEKETP